MTIQAQVLAMINELQEKLGTAIIMITHLKRYFKVSKGTLHAVDDINLSIRAGTTLGVVGESGCGKSTLGRTILRLTEPTSGQVLFNGKDITKLSKSGMQKMRTDMQIIFQDPSPASTPE